MLIGRDRWRYPIAQLNVERQFLLLREWPERQVDVVADALQLDLCRIDVHLPGFDLRQIEDVVDEREQVAARTVDRLRKLDLFVVEVVARILSKELRQDQEAVQRSAELVRHVCKELRLVLRAQRQLFGLLLQLRPRVLDLLVLHLDRLVLLAELSGLVL